MAERKFDKVKINVNFTEAASRQSLDSGDSITTLFGKVKKWLSDLKPVAFSGSYNDLSDKPTIPDVDGELSDTSENPVQNKVVTEAFNTKANTARKYTISISASESWTSGTSCKYITKTVTGLRTTADIDVTPVLSASDHSAAALQLEAYKCILNGNVVISADDTVTIYCYGDTPTTALTLDVMTKE